MLESSKPRSADKDGKIIVSWQDNGSGFPFITGSEEYLKFYNKNYNKLTTFKENSEEFKEDINIKYLDEKKNKAKLEYLGGQVRGLFITSVLAEEHGGNVIVSNDSVKGGAIIKMSTNPIKYNKYLQVDELLEKKDINKRETKANADDKVQELTVFQKSEPILNTESVVNFFKRRSKMQEKTDVMSTTKNDDRIKEKLVH